MRSTLLETNSTFTPKGFLQNLQAIHFTRNVYFSTKRSARDGIMSPIPCNKKTHKILLWTKSFFASRTIQNKTRKRSKRKVKEKAIDRNVSSLLISLLCLLLFFFPFDICEILLSWYHNVVESSVAKSTWEIVFEESSSSGNGSF